MAQWGKFCRAVAASVCLTLSAAAQQPEKRTLLDSGPTANRVNIVLLGDGYVESEKDQFFAHAASRLAAIREDEAFLPFREHINGFAIFTASAESGTDRPFAGVFRTTFYHTTFQNVSGSRLLYIGSGEGTSRVNEILQSLMPEYDLVVVLVNTEFYGGAGGQPIVASLHAQSAEIVLHEAGHSFAGLTDEYVDAATAPSFPPREYDNATQTTHRDSIPWRAFILDTTAVPTPITGPSDPNRVGLFEGSHYRATGFYRPTQDSKMRTLGQPWGPVNLRAFARALHVLDINQAETTATVVVDPRSQVVVPGTGLTLEVVAEGTGPFTYQWSRDGKYIPGATNRTFQIVSTSAGDAGIYSVEISNARGTVVSQAATVAANPLLVSRLTNLSVRTTLAGDDSVVVGFVITGGDKEILVRAVGPGLSPFLVGAHPDPRIELHGGTGLPIVSNDDWPAPLAPSFLAAGAFPLVPGSRDAAVMHPLSSANTAVVRGTGSGILLVEAYDVGGPAERRLINLSARNRVGAGDDRLIAGFVVSGIGPKRILVRGAGPALAALGVTGVLADPQLEVYAADGSRRAVNDNWSGELAARFTAVGAFAFERGSRDSALEITLEPGAYSAHLSGVDGTTGEGLIEVYELP